MEEFRKFLKSTYIQGRYIPYYIRWIKKCYSYLNFPITEKIHNYQKNQFLKYLSALYEDWQIRQADYAIELYQYYLFQKEKEDVLRMDMVRRGNSKAIAA